MFVFYYNCTKSRAWKRKSRNANNREIDKQLYEVQCNCWNNTRQRILYARSWLWNFALLCSRQALTVYLVNSNFIIQDYSSTGTMENALSTSRITWTVITCKSVHDEFTRNFHLKHRKCRVKLALELWGDKKVFCRVFGAFRSLI